MPRTFTHIYTISHRNRAPSIDNASILLDRDSFLHETYVEIIQYFLFYGVFEPTSSFADRVVTLSSVWIIIARDYYRFPLADEKEKNSHALLRFSRRRNNFLLPFLFPPSQPEAVKLARDIGGRGEGDRSVFTVVYSPRSLGHWAHFRGRTHPIQ